MNEKRPSSRYAQKRAWRIRHLGGAPIPTVASTWEEARRVRRAAIEKHKQQLATASAPAADTLRTFIEAAAASVSPVWAEIAASREALLRYGKSERSPEPSYEGTVRIEGKTTEIEAAKALSAEHDLLRKRVLATVLRPTVNGRDRETVEEAFRPFVGADQLVVSSSVPTWEEPGGKVRYESKTTEIDFRYRYCYGCSAGYSDSLATCPHCGMGLDSSRPNGEEQP